MSCVRLQINDLMGGLFASWPENEPGLEPDEPEPELLVDADDQHNEEDRTREPPSPAIRRRLAAVLDDSDSEDGHAPCDRPSSRAPPVKSGAMGREAKQPDPIDLTGAHAPGDDEGRPSTSSGSHGLQVRPVTARGDQAGSMPEMSSGNQATPVTEFDGHAGSMPDGSVQHALASSASAPALERHRTSLPTGFAEPACDPQKQSAASAVPVLDGQDAFREMHVQQAGSTAAGSGQLGFTGQEFTPAAFPHAETASQGNVAVKAPGILEPSISEALNSPAGGGCNDRDDSFAAPGKPVTGDQAARLPEAAAKDAAGGQHENSGAAEHLLFGMPADDLTTLSDDDLMLSADASHQPASANIPAGLQLGSDDDPMLSADALHQPASANLSTGPGLGSQPVETSCQNEAGGLSMQAAEAQMVDTGRVVDTVQHAQADTALQHPSECLSPAVRDAALHDTMQHSSPGDPMHGQRLSPAVSAMHDAALHHSMQQTPPVDLSPTPGQHAASSTAAAHGMPRVRDMPPAEVREGTPLGEPGELSTPHAQPDEGSRPMDAQHAGPVRIHGQRNDSLEIDAQSQLGDGSLQDHSGLQSHSERSRQIIAAAAAAGSASPQLPQPTASGSRGGSAKATSKTPASSRIQQSPRLTSTPGSRTPKQSRLDQYFGRRP